MTVKLSDIFYLGRASRYTNPKNSNDRLPIVYGTLTDGTEGIWTAPCIDTVNFVYCAADHETFLLSAVYADGELVDGADYAVNTANNYESKGVITTITFTSDQANKTISVRGIGKVDGSDLPILNIVDIVYDFLTVENDLTSADIDVSAKNKASQIFTLKGYQAAGVIGEDVVIWDLITEMMGSFLGGAYKSGEGKLILEIDVGTVNQYGQTIIRKSDTKLTAAKQRLKNVINRCPVSYAYNYIRGEFAAHSSGTTTADTASQGIHGVREPNTPFQLYWCRHAPSVAILQAVIIDKLKSPIYEVEIETPDLIHVDVDRGDIVVATIDDLYDSEGSPLYNQYWKVIAPIYDFSKSRMKFRLQQTNYYMTMAYLASGGYVLSSSGVEWDGGIEWGGDIDWAEEDVTYLVADGSILAGNNRDTTLY